MICLCSAYAYAVFMLMPCLCLCSVFPAWCVLVCASVVFSVLRFIVGGGGGRGGGELQVCF